MVRVLFDITRLARRDAEAQPTGIDRVALAYGRWLTGRPDIDLVPVLSAGGRLLAVRLAVLERLLDRACRVSGNLPPDHPTWTRLVSAMAADSPPDRPLRSPMRSDWPQKAASRALTGVQAVLARGPQPRGDVYLNVAHRGLEHPSLLTGLTRKGVRRVVMVHDLIPMTHPQYCAAGAPERHRRRIDGILESGATIIANSQTTADSVLAYALAERRPPPPIALARLGVEAAFRCLAAPLTAARPYFVAVGTIEPRKNLAFLLRLWTRLEAELGEGTPRLVLVGRRGWERRAVLEALDRSAVARRRVLEAGDLPDPALACLMAGAAALLAPSNVEGFDLPAVEALSLGTPVIASDIAAHRELAVGARLIPVDDEAGWLGAASAAAQGRPATPPFAAPGWRAHFDIVADLLGLRRGSLADSE